MTTEINKGEFYKNNAYMPIQIAFLLLKQCMTMLNAFVNKICLNQTKAEKWHNLNSDCIAE